MTAISALVTHYTRRVAEAILLCLGLATSVNATTRIEIVVNTNSNDTLASDQVQRLAVVPPTTQPIAPGLTLQDLVAQFYGVRPTVLPQTYAELIRQIQSLNGLGSLTSPLPPSLVLPSVPKTSSPLRFVQSTVPKGTLLRALNLEQPIAESIGREPQETREANQTVISIEAPDDRAVALLGEFRRSGLQARFVAGPLSIRFAASQVTQDQVNGLPSPFLSEDADAFIALTKRPPVSAVPLYIVDTGWPDATTFSESRQALAGMLDAVRRGWRLGPSSNVVYSSNFIEPLLGDKSHCKELADSLKGVERFGASHVHPIYIPLSREQHGDEVLREFLRLDFIARRMFDGHVLGQKDPTEDLLQAASVSADQDLVSVPANIDGDDIRTDRAVVEAIVNVVDLFARTGPNAPFRYVFNLSWTVIGEFDEPRLPAAPLGVFVAAAGNVKNLDIYANKIDFARRSLDHRDTLAVLNIDSSGATLCDSSIFDIAVVDDAMVVGYDGRVAANVCGTSFAAPRVAWIIALREAWIPSSLHPERWATDLFNRLKRQRGTTNGFSRVWFRPASYIKDSQ